MTNHARGEIEVMLDDVAYLLRPTFEALCHVEDATGKSLMTLAEHCSAGQVTLSDIVTILQIAIDAGGGKLPKKAIGEAVIRQGVGAMLVIAAKFLSVALSGEDTLKKKPEEVLPGNAG